MRTRYSIHPDADSYAYIEPHLEDARLEALELLRSTSGMRTLIEARYREGERLYNREWLTKPLDWFDAEAGCELADLVTYLAMKRAAMDLEAVA